MREIAKRKKMFKYKYFTILFYYSLTCKKYNRKKINLDNYILN